MKYVFKIILKRYACPDYINDLLKSYLGFFTPVLVSLSFLVTFLITISSIIREKESKMKVGKDNILKFVFFNIRLFERIYLNKKEYLRLIGVNPVVIWLCWMMRSFVIYLLISIIATVTASVQLNAKYPNPISDKKSLFLTTDTVLVFFMFFVYSIQVTSLSLLAGQIFVKRKIKVTAIIIMLW